MIKEPILYIQHILDSIEHIEQFLEGIEKDNFIADRMRYDATLRNLQTLSEATQKLPQEIKDKYLAIPWRDISGFRNILVHDYLEGLDINIVWHIVKYELIPIKIAMLDMKRNV